MGSRLWVTTSHKAKPPARERALRYCDTWDLPFIERNDAPIANLIQDDRPLLVFTNSEVHLAVADTRLRFHLGTAFIRLLSLRRGDGDPLVRACDAAPGDSVLDTTLGLGRDARVIAEAIGPTGQVDGLESSAPLFHLASIGFAALGEEPDRAPISVTHVDARAHLRNLDPNSYDVVIIDPMFNSPTTSDPGFELLRSVADPHPLTREWVQDARRVARRCVVVKTRGSHYWFADEELTWVPSNSNAGWYRAPSAPG